MKKIKVIVEIKNKEKPYYYEGIATLNKDIITCNDGINNIIYDKKINRLIKKDSEKEIRIDFVLKNITIIMKNQQLSFDIEVIELYSSEELIKAKYKLDKEEIECALKVL